MADVWNFFVKANALIPEYPRWVFWVVVVIVLVLSELAKIPIKYFTNKIANETLRKKVNTTIMLLPILFGFLASWFLTVFGFSFSTTAALVWGTISQVIYEFISRIVKRVKNGDDITNETIKEDLQDSVDSVEKKTETAEEKFNELVEKIKKGE